MNFRGWMRALVKYWWIVLGVTALALVMGVGVLGLSENKYATSVTFFANTSSDVAGSAMQGDQYGQRRINTYVQMVDSERLARMIVADTGLDLTPAQVMTRVTAKGDPNTVLLTATVVDSDPDRSAAIAGSIATQLVALVSQLETPPGGATPTVRLEIIGGPDHRPGARGTAARSRCWG